MWWLIAPALLLQFLATMTPSELPPPVRESLRRQAWADRSVAPSAEMTSPEPSVAYFGGNDGVAYLLYRPDFSNRVVYLRSESPEALARDMDRAAVSVVYVGRKSPRHEDIAREAVRRKLLVGLHGGFYRREKAFP